MAISTDEIEESLSDTKESGEEEEKNEKSQSSLFWLVSIGTNSSQLILLNFFQYFAAEVGVSQSILGFVTAIRNLISAIFQGRIGFSSDKHGRRIFLLFGFFLSFATTTLLIF